MSLLDQEAPGLRATLVRLSAGQRRRALCEAILVISRGITDFEPRIREILEVAVRDQVLSTDQLAELKKYTDDSDDRYFTAQEQGADERVWGNWFAKARLGAATLNLFRGATLEDAAECAYELCFAASDKQIAIDAIESAMTRVHSPSNKSREQ